MEIAVYKPL